MMHGREKSDPSIVAVKLANKTRVPGDRSSSLGWKTGQPEAESVELS